MCDIGGIDNVSVSDKEISKARDMILSHERQGNCYFPLIDTLLVARNGVEERLGIYYGVKFAGSTYNPDHLAIKDC